MQLPTVSEAVLFRFLVVINSLFILIGGGMVGFGIYQHTQSPEVAEDLEDASSDGTMAIVSGFLDLMVGSCGLAGALFKKRILLFANLGLVGFVTLTNVAIMIVFPAAAFDDMNDARNGVKNNLVKFYGDLRTADGLDFTSRVDNEQRKEDCCGFTGINGENIFLQTEWYKKQNHTAGDETTLPNSCCIKPDTTCSKAKDVKVARDEGSVFKEDCMDKMEREAERRFWVTMSQLILVTIMQLSLLAMISLALLQGQTT